MILTGPDILSEIQRGFIRIDPFNPEQMNPNSYDVRLGNHFYEVTWDGDGPWFIGPIYVPDGERIPIPTRGTLLGATVELIGARDHVVAQLRSKSSTRRMGVTICDDAGFGDVGYWNRWTVELTAHVSYGQPFLVVGERFAQAVFQLAASGGHGDLYTGQYTAADWPEAMVPRKYRDRIRSGR